MDEAQKAALKASGMLSSNGNVLAVEFVPNRLGLAVFHIAKACVAMGVAGLAGQYGIHQIQNAWALRKE